MNFSDKPSFSIIIPTFNSSATIKSCLESIFNQTFLNFEVWIIDGGSTDETIKLVTEYALEFHNIYWISEKDKGIYDAMNKGIKMANGDWIYFLGSDDTIYDKNVFLNIKSSIAENNSVDVVYGNIYSTRFNGIYDGEFTVQNIYDKNICHQSIFFKKKIFSQIGNFNIRYRSHADWDHNFKWFLSKKIKHAYINTIIANYADGGFSSMNEDLFFKSIKQWKYNLLTKQKYGLKYKLQIVKLELKKAFKEERKRDALIILFQTPYFLL